jgi:hypothetical protein
MGNDLAGIAKALRSLDKADIKNWLRRGELLTEAKQLAANDATFRTWLRREAIATRTAQKAMAAWRHFGTAPTSARFSKEAMSILGQSPEAREEALQLATAKRITAKIARQLVAKHVAITPATVKPLSAHQADHYEELIPVDGGAIIIRLTATATISDMLGMMMQAQRALRDRMTRAA